MTRASSVSIDAMQSKIEALAVHVTVNVNVNVHVRS
jgi:hypothetical protein